MNYAEAVDYIHGLGRFGSRPGLERIQAALKKLGNPQDTLPVIHVAGTNGKGSTSCMLASILRAAGLTTGLYTSPYLDSFTNRFGLDGADISEAELVAMVQAIRPVAEEVGLTQFEFITTLAFHYYKQRNIDILVLEVGLGGRFDATNVVRPLISVITNIGYDHVEILGNTLSSIAYEKAGIIKSGVPVITAADVPEAIYVIAEVAKDKGAPLRQWGKDFKAVPRQSGLMGQSFDYRGYLDLTGIDLRMLGPHQVINAAVAIDTILTAKINHGLQISEEHIRQGLRTAAWPGRFEIMRQRPYVIMDGAHNSHGVAALSNTLQQLLPGKKVRLVSGILRDKDPRTLLNSLLQHVEHLYACSPAIPRATSAEELASIGQELGISASSYTSVAEALQAAIRDAAVDDVILVAGSLYTVSEARKGLA